MKKTVFMLCLILYAVAVQGQSKKWEKLNEQLIQLYGEGNYQKAVTIAHKALAEAEKAFGRQHENYAASLNNLAVLYQDMGNYVQAELQYKEALPILKIALGEDHPSYANSLNDLAMLYKSLGDYTQAEPLLKEAMHIYKTAFGNSHPEYANALNNAALLYEDLGDYAQAESLSKEALQIRKTALGENHPDYATSLNNLAGLYRLMGNYVQAELLYKETLRIKKTALGEKHPDYATSLNNFAGLYYNMGNYPQAERLYKEALQIRKSVLGENHPDYAVVLNNLAMVYDNMGDYAQAEPLYQRALQIRKNALGETHPEYANSLGNLAGFYEYMGNYTQAEPLHKEALQIRRSVLGERHPYCGNSLNSLAVLYYKMGQYAQAEPLYQEALQIYKTALGENHPEYANVLSNLAVLYRSTGNYSQAEAMYNQAIRIKKGLIGEAHPDYAASLNNLAILYADFGNYAQAERLYKETLQIIGTALGESHPSYATSLGGLAGVYERQGHYTRAEQLYLQAQDIRFSLLQSTFPGLSEQEKEQFLATFENDFELFHSFVLRQRTARPALVGRQYDNLLRLKGILLQSQVQMRQRIARSRDASLLKTYEDWVTARRSWNSALSLTQEERQHLGLDLNTLDRAANELEKELSRRSEGFAATFDNSTGVSWQEVQKVLGKKDAAIEILRFKWRNQHFWTDTIHYAALLVAPGLKQPHYVFLPDGNLMESRGLEGYREAVGVNDDAIINLLDETPIMSADSVYVLLWQPIQRALDSLGSFRTVYLSPDGVYHSVNLETLQLPGQQGYLKDRMDLRIVGSTRDLVRKVATKKSTAPAALFGFPNYKAEPEQIRQAFHGLQQSGNALPPHNNYHQTFRALERYGSLSLLPGTKEEVQQIQQLVQELNIPSRTFLENAASEEVLLTLPPPRVLHIATHGFFETDTPDRASSSGAASAKRENPYLRCGLFLAGAQHSLNNRKEREGGTTADGILTAYEAVNLHLEGTELVVLSACETGRGSVKNGEGVYGLHRAFQIAGAQTIVYSLWKVADQQTQELMADFYRLWLKEGKPKREAFIQAQQNLRQEYPEPYFWGAFVLVGE